MKILIAAVAVFSLTALGHAADEEKSVQELRDEIALLKTTLAKVQDESVTYFSTSVAVRSKYEAAVLRINEANDVARQWRSKAVNLQHELSYTKAIAVGTTTVDLEKVWANSNTPHFRISNIPSREEGIVRDDGVSPTFASAR